MMRVVHLHHDWHESVSLETREETGERSLHAHSPKVDLYTEYILGKAYIFFLVLWKRVCSNEPRYYGSGHILAFWVCKETGLGKRSRVRMMILVSHHFNIYSLYLDIGNLCQLSDLLIPHVSNS